MSGGLTPCRLQCMSPYPRVDEVVDISRYISPQVPLVC